jgi:hypothetical protein
VGLRTGLDDVEKRSCPYWDWNSDPSAVRLVLICRGYSLKLDYYRILLLFSNSFNFIISFEAV